MARNTEQFLLRTLMGVAAVGTLGIGACSATAQTRTAEPFRWEGSLGAGILEIKGVNGAIAAQPATGSVAVIEATRRGRRSDPEEVQIVVVEHSGGVTVCAVYPSSGSRVNECLPGDEGRIGANNNDVQVDFVVHVPPTVDLVARTTNGEVDVQGLSGDVEVRGTNGDVRVDGAASVVARTTNGSISIRTSGYASAASTNGAIEADLPGLGDGSEPLSFTTTNGTITLRVPANTNATLSARTANGRIESDLPILVQGTVARNRLEGTIGTGGRVIELRTTNGRIHLERGS